MFVVVGLVAATMVWRYVSFVNVSLLLLCTKNTAVCCRVWWRPVVCSHTSHCRTHKTYLSPLEAWPGQIAVDSGSGGHQCKHLSSLLAIINSIEHPVNQHQRFSFQLQKIEEVLKWLDCMSIILPECDNLELNQILTLLDYKTPQDLLLSIKAAKALYWPYTCINCQVIGILQSQFAINNCIAIV